MSRIIHIKGTKRGFRSISIMVYQNGQMLRGDVRLDLAAVIPNQTEAASIIGMTRDEFRAILTPLRAEMKDKGLWPL